MNRWRLLLVVESGVDVRLVEGLAERFELSIFARQIPGGVAISQSSAVDVPVTLGPPQRTSFARQVLRRLTREPAPDLVIVQGYGLAALTANLAGRWRRIPTFMLVCSPVEAYYRCRRTNPHPGKPFRWHELVLIQGVARLNAQVGQRYIVLSEYLRDVVQGHGGRCPINIIPVYGVDTTCFVPPREEKSTVRARLGLPLSGKLLFYSSRVAPEKDSQTLLTAVRELLRAGHDLWLLHRSGGYRQFLRDAEQMGIADRIIATDAVHPHEKLPLDYQASDLCIQASREEGLGFSPLEALASGVPVIAADVGGLRETILNGGAGWTYPVGDAAALAQCIQAVFSDPQAALLQAMAGRELVCSRFDRRVVFDRLTHLINDLMIPCS